MPTERNDSITIAARLVTWGLGGADEFHYSGGSATIHGGDTGEAYDTNVYGAKTGGDRLFIESNAGTRIHLTSTEDGTVMRGNETLTFTGIERLVLGNGNDIVRAGQATLDRYGLSVWTGGGNDQVNGTRAGDFIDPGEGNDRVWAGAGEDFINGSRGNDTIFGGAGNDNIRWGQGTAEGNSGTKGLAYGNDVLNGGTGSDVVNLWAHDWDGTGVSVKMTSALNGTATIDFTGTTETARFSSFETVWTHEGRDTIDGSGADIGLNAAGFHGGARWGNDVLIGSAGRDTLEGGEGRDTITGGRGNDLISTNGDFYNMSAPGDGDADTLIFRAGHGADTVLGFDVGVDRLDLGGRHYSVSENGQGTLLNFGGGDTILLSHVFDF